jgi:hypothetical protein
VKGTGAQFSHVGRWPSNLVLVHGPKCRQDGAWKCPPKCVVATLDAQSGELTSGFMEAGTFRKGSGFYAPGSGGGESGTATRADTGGASRFYPQFRDDAEVDSWLTRLILGPSEPLCHSAEG